MKVGSRMRFCHADHLLHSAVTNIDSEQDIEDLPELTPVPTKPEITDSTTRAESEGVSVPVPVRCSNQEIRAPCRLIEEL